jgi:ATP-dependent DNA ligase
MKPMLARLVRELPQGDYIFEPKWDGFRCLVAEADGQIEMVSRHGRSLARYFPELVSAFRQVRRSRWMVDGEILAPVDGRFDFEVLMSRLHPAASRVRDLSARFPAVFVAFDLPAIEGRSLASVPFAQRRTELLSLLEAAAPAGRQLLEAAVPAGGQLLEGSDPSLFVTPATTDRALAERWLSEFQGGGVDGVVAKYRELGYESGARAMLKVKHERTAECVVGGMRLAGTPPEVMSLLLGLFDSAGQLEHIGVVSSFSQQRRLDLVGELADLATPLPGHPWQHGFLTAGGAMGRLKGAAGRWVPGMTLDWVPLRPERVLEVSYTHVDGWRLRHPAKFVRWRADRDPQSCGIDQLDPADQSSWLARLPSA